MSMMYVCIEEIKLRFTLYTDKSVRQCLSAINDRMQEKETKSRPAMDGWIEKSGEFAITTTCPVAFKFARTTKLRAHAKRENGITIVQGVVPNGASRQQQTVIFGVLGLVALVVIANGDAMLGLMALLLGFALYIPLTGDYHNSEILYKDLKRILKAKETPPKS
jgi:hypothetical protein